MHNWHFGWLVLELFILELSILKSLESVFRSFFLSCSEIRFLSLHFDYLLSQSRTGHVIFQKRFLPSKYRTSNRTITSKNVDRTGSYLNQTGPGLAQKFKTWTNSNKNLKSEQIGVMRPSADLLVQVNLKIIHQSINFFWCPWIHLPHPRFHFHRRTRFT